METEVIEKYKKAGEIAKKARENAKNWIKPGAKVLDIVQKTEDLIQAEGAGFAFPLNISINEVSAHYTPDSDSTLEIGKDDLVKFDVGVLVDGYIADTAVTFSMNQSEEQLKLIEAAEAALEKALSIVKPGLDVGEIGEAVEQAITEKGFKPIENLTGHGLDKYALHAGLLIPNVSGRGGMKLEDGQAVAIEPFSTNGFGSVIDSNEIHIYEFLMAKPSRMMEVRKILDMAENKFNGLPFAKRWLEKDISRLKLAMALRELVNGKSLYQYPVLKEKENGLVAQAEHTVIVLDEPIVTTK